MIIDQIIDEVAELKKEVCSRIVTIQNLTEENKLLRQELDEKKEALESCINMLEKDQVFPIRKQLINLHALPEEV